MLRKSLITTIIAGGLLLGACGGETVYVTVEPSTTTTVRPPKSITTNPNLPVSTRPPVSVNTYDPEAYDTFLWEQVNDFWWLFTKEELLNMGLIVCEEFDRGQSLDQVSETLVQIMVDTNTAHLMDGLAAVTGAALTFLCPEHSWWLESI